MLVPPSPLEWLSVAQVAEELQLSQQQIKQYIARGDLPATKDLNKRGTPWLVERSGYLGLGVESTGERAGHDLVDAFLTFDSMRCWS